MKNRRRKTLKAMLSLLLSAALIAGPVSALGAEYEADAVPDTVDISVEEESSEEESSEEESSEDISSVNISTEDAAADTATDVSYDVVSGASAEDAEADAAPDPGYMDDAMPDENAGTASADEEGSAEESGEYVRGAVTLGSSKIAAGNRVWFASAGGAPLSWKVLGESIGTTVTNENVGRKGKLLLAEQSVGKATAGNNWNSDNEVRNYLQSFYNAMPDSPEKDAILATTKLEKNDQNIDGKACRVKVNTSDYSSALYFYAAPLIKEEIFPLSAEEVLSFFPTKKDRQDLILPILRSPGKEYVNGSYTSTGMGYIFHKDAFPASCGYFYITTQEVDICPAINFDPSNVLYTLEDASDSSYDMVIGKPGLTITGMTDDDQYAINGREVTVPYSYAIQSGSSVGQLWNRNPKLYVMVTDRPYDPSNVSGTSVLQYTELTDKVDTFSGPFGSRGTGKFVIDEDITGVWGSDYHVYIVGIGENKNDRVRYGSFSEELTAPTHVHDFTYTADGNTITAVCHTHGCDITSGLTMTISAPTNLDYNGMQKSAKINSGYNTTAFPGSHPITYRKSGFQSVVSALNVKNAGDYTASFSHGGLTASVAFTINKVPSTIKTAPKPYNREYSTLARTLLRSSGTAEGGTMYYALGESDTVAPTDPGAWSTTAPKGSDVGVYHIWYKVIGDSNHYNTEPACVTTTVTKADYYGLKTMEATAVSGNDMENVSLALPSLPEGAVYASTGTVSQNETLITRHAVSGNTLIYDTADMPVGTSATIVIPVSNAKNFNDYDVKVTVKVRDARDAGVTIATGKDSVEYGDLSFDLQKSVEDPGENGEWRFLSTNPDAAEINSSGRVTVKVPGTTTIIATYESDDTYGRDTLLLTVEKRKVRLEGVTVEPTKVYDGTTSAKITSYGTMRRVLSRDSSEVFPDNDEAAANYSDKHVSENKAVYFTGFSLSGNKAGYYQISEQPSSVIAGITPKEVTASVTAVDRVYAGGDLSVTLTDMALVGDIDGDDISLDIDDVKGYMADPDAGNDKPVTVTGAEIYGEDEGNYTFVQPTDVTVNIRKATINNGRDMHLSMGYIYDQEYEEIIDLETIVPSGAVIENVEGPETSGDIDYKTAPAVSEGVLYYVLNKTSGSKSGSIRLTIKMKNYNDLKLTVNIRQSALSLAEKSGGSYKICNEKTICTGKSINLAPLFSSGEVTNERVVWETSDPDVATVTQTGRVTGRSKGSVIISATSEEKPEHIGYCMITVEDPVTEITLDNTKYRFGTGEVLNLNASVLPYSADGDIIWMTSDSSVVTVCTPGGTELTGRTAGKIKVYDVVPLQSVQIKAVGPGSAKVTAATADGSGIKAVCSFTVGNPVPAFTISGKGGASEIKAGKSLAMTANWGQSKPANTGLTWSVRTDNPMMTPFTATISDKGVLTGIMAGRVTVTATSIADPSKKAEIQVTIAPPASTGPAVTGITITNKESAEKKSLNVGKTLKLKTKLTLSGKGRAAADAVAWVSLDESVATVSQKGVVKGIAPGDTVIVAVSRKEIAVWDYVTITVDAPVKSLKADKKKMTLGTKSNIYGKLDIAAITPANATNTVIKWVTNNKNIKLCALEDNESLQDGNYRNANVRGVVTDGESLGIQAVSPGVTKITGYATDGSNKKVTCTVTIRGEVTGLSLQEKGAVRGVNDVTATGVTGMYTGTMKANSKMTLKPVVDVNGISGSTRDRSDLKIYKAYKKYTDTSVSYRSSDTSVLTVTSGGKIQVKNGTSGRTATVYVATADGEYRAEVLITVK